MNRDMLSQHLIRRSFQVVLAMDGQPSVELARSERPDIVLMDVSCRSSTARKDPRVRP